MNIVGHNEIREQLNNIVISDKVGHAYLFVGKSGIGKKLVATEFAKNIMCSNRIKGTSCNTCESCKTFGNNADFFIVEPENDIIKVDAIRSFETEVYLKPTVSSRKCIIINDADFMNESAQNALLKILEEPPSYATIILVATNKEKLLNTIKSRVVTISFNRLTNKELLEILGEGIDKEVLAFAEGSVKRALSISDKNYINLAENIVFDFKTRDFLVINKRLDYIKGDKNLKQNISDILEMVMFLYYREIKDNLVESVQMIDIINDTNRDIKRNANVDLALDNMAIRICF